MRISNRRWQFVLVVAWIIPVAAAVLSASHIIGRFRGNDRQESLSLVVDLSERSLTVLEGGEVARTYSIAVGRSSNPTPTGSYRIGRVVWNPGWVPPPSKWARNMRARAPGDPRNPMQGVKMYFREPWYYIHGTNDPGSIGEAASRGCIRMRVGDAKALARRIVQHPGSVPLEIHG